MSSKVDNPEHYTQGDIECIQAMEANSTPEAFQEHCRLTALKYLWRCNYKENKRQDLEKAVWYIKRVLTSMGKSKLDAYEVTPPIAADEYYTDGRQPWLNRSTNGKK